uniref:AraC family transcriptional regulator n=1 Tax=Anisakis simplex TaxID=6269 RepID=A0A0M3JPI3_ANISI
LKHHPPDVSFQFKQYQIFVHQPTIQLELPYSHDL